MMARTGFIAALVVVVVPSGVLVQNQQVEPVEVRCPSVLGIGLSTDMPFCDVEVQRDANLGILVVLPPHRGEATVSFNLHNRHTYSEQEERVGRAYAQYLATIAVATMEGEVIARGVVLSEFRSAADLFDRITGGAGPGGLKAIAPTGMERVNITVPSGVTTVSVVGQSLEVLRSDQSDTFRSLGRAVAVLSDAVVEYRPH